MIRNTSKANLTVEVWKDILTPNSMFENYQASNLGHVRYVDPLTKTTKVIAEWFRNRYLYVHLGKAKKEGKKEFSLHRLIAIAFHKLPADGIFNKSKLNHNDEIPYIVNHKDGNKRNNVPSNIEWCDHTTNNNHSLDNNLNNKKVPVSFKDLVTGEIHNLRSIQQMTEVLDIRHENAAQLMTICKEVPYKERYLMLDVDYSLFESQVRKKLPFDCMDFVTRKVTRYSSPLICSINTGCHSKSIIRQLGHKRIKSLAGYGFRMIGSSRPWKDITTHEAITERETHHAIVRSGKRQDSDVVTLRHIKTNELSTLRNVNALAKFMEVSSSLIHRKLNKLKDGKGSFLYNGYVVSIGNDVDELIYTDEDVSESLREYEWVKSGGSGPLPKKIRCINKAKDMDVVAHSRTIASKITDITKSNIKHLVNKPGSASRSGWSFQYV